MTLLRFDNVRAGYDTATVLQGLNLEVGRGERVALMGRNGVGKTTVVNTLLGVTRLHGGTIQFGSTVVLRRPHYLAARSGISVVPQGRQIIGALTVRENLLLGGASGRRGEWDLDAVYRLYPILKERAETSGMALSGGQQQMLAIGRALMANPDLLVLDEPSEGLAPVIVDELASTFNDLAAKGCGILLIEQNIGLVRRVAERYYILSKGYVVDQGPLLDLSTEAIRRHIAV